MIYFLCAAGGVCFVSALLNGTFNIANKNAHRMVAKTIASTLFCVIALASAATAKNFSSYAVWVTLALFVGALGDIFLCAASLVEKAYKTLIEVLGIVCFFSGHIVYIILFLSLTSFNFYLLPIIVVMPIAFIISEKIGFVKAGKLLYICLGYSLVLGLMVISVVNLYLNFKTDFSLIVMIAGILFALSDVFLVVRNWGNISGKIRNALVIAVAASYYLAQILFALSVNIAF